MSPFVVHFAKADNTGSAYEHALSILYNRVIEARRPFGASKNSAHSRKSACFSKIPLHQLKRLADHRGKHGIGFRKELLVERGGGPILYAYRDTDHAKAVNTMVLEAEGDPHHPIWTLAPFIDLPGVGQKKTYLWEWEREWRFVGDFHFEPADAAFLILPADRHDDARSFFDDAEAENIGPNYKCKFIDPYWSQEEVQAVLGG